VRVECPPKYEASLRSYFGDNFDTGLFLLLYFISGAAFMPLWVHLAEQFGKEKAWMMSMILAVFAFIWAFFLGAGDGYQYGIICLLSGMALGADLSLPPSILADRITSEKKEADATQYYALLAFIPKIAVAVVSGVSFLILGEFGFEAGAENSVEALNAMAFLYALIPCLIKLSAAALLWSLYTKEEYHVSEA